MNYLDISISENVKTQSPRTIMFWFNIFYNILGNIACRGRLGVYVGMCV